MKVLKKLQTHLHFTRQKIFALFGAQLILFSTIVTLPIIEWVTIGQYQLDDTALSLVGEADTELASKLVYNKQDNLYQFNPDAKAPESNDPAEVAKQLASKQNVTGDTSDKQLYSLDLSPDAKQGMTIYDNNSKLSFKMTPQFNKKQGRKVQDRLIYPMSDGAKAVYTVKNNGLKEDIVFDQAPASGEASYSYKLELPDSLEARLADDGSLGIYSADPNLFGDISFGSDDDREKIESARKNAPKDYLVFGLPKPVIVAENGKIGDAYAKFQLDGDTLTVTARNLTTIDGAFSLDPSVVVTSASDFSTGNDEGNIDFSTSGQIGRGGLTGGSIGAWAGTTSLMNARDRHVSVAYNGYVYVIGGSRSDVHYAPINASGTIGSWAATTGLATTREYHTSVAYNGYLYVLGGYGGPSYSQLNDVQYAPINANGTLGAWSATTSFMTARFEHTSIAYNGHLYVLGGFSNGSGALNDVQYAPINANGTLGAWSATTSFTTSRHDHASVAYNGYLYVLGGDTSSSNGRLSDVQYAPINANGTLGAWSTTASFTTARYGHASVVYNGYLYITGGYDTSYLSDVQYAPINANGTLGAWSTTASFTTARYNHTSVVYNGYLYIIGGDSGSILSDLQYAKINPPGVTGSYASTSSFSAGRYEHKSVVYNGYIYVSGGIETYIYRNDVQYAPVNADGTVGTWAATTSFATARADHTLVAYNGYMYVLGGYDDNSDYNTVQYTPINANGTLGTWTATTSFTTGRSAHSSVAYNGYMYVIAGSGAGVLSDVQYAPINANGTLGTWTATTSLPSARYSHTSEVYGGYLYVIGGTSEVRYAPINANGTLGTWALAGSMPDSAALNDHASVLYNGFLYVLGGYKAGVVSSGVYYAAVNSDGTLGSWTATASLTSRRDAHDAVVHGGTIYTLGGFDDDSGAFLNTVQYARINNGGPGTTGTWSTTTAMSTSRYRHASLVYNGYLYILGGYDGSLLYNTVHYAPINANGTLGSWSSTSSFSSARMYHSAVAYNGYMYVLGGENSGATILNDVQYAPINANGTLGAWTATASLPTGLRQHTAEAYGGYIYVLGGSDGSAYQNTVRFAEINADGTLGGWTATTSFTTPRIFHESLVYNGYIYIFGGAGSGFTPLSSVQYAQIDPSGTLGPWQATTSLEGGRFYGGAAVDNGYVYMVGGSVNGAYSANVSLAPINVGGSIGDWQKTVSLPQDRAFLTSEIHNGHIYAIGGQTTGQVLYSSLNVIPRKAKYSKLIDLGASMTIQKVSYSGYLGPSGSISFRVAGDDGVMGATNTTIRSCLTGVSGRYIFITAEMDDGSRASYPDSLSSKASLQDITVDYSSGGAVDPLKRLRGGKYFSDGGVLQELDTKKTVVATTCQ